MRKRASKLATVRQHGATQVDAQRTNILDAAERRFLDQGLEHTTIADIAEQAGITRMTLYRYFRDRDTIAFEIAVRMLERIMSVEVPESGGDDEEGHLLQGFKTLSHAIIRNFNELRDAYRYLGMFDHLYTDRYPTEELAAWYREHMDGLKVSGISRGDFNRDFPYFNNVLMVLNNIISFLQRMAARGELMAVEQGLSMEDQLRLFDDMVGLYFDRLLASRPRLEKAVN